MFNLVVSDRIASGKIGQVEAYDYLQLDGTNSFFNVSPEEVENCQARLLQGDVHLTGPLIGERSLDCQANPAEKAIIEKQQALISLMKNARMNEARRAMLCQPKELRWAFEAEGLRLRFFLESGSYATALVRELIQLDEEA